MANAEVQFYFRFRIGWRSSLQKVNVYQINKFRSYSSIYVWVITISVLKNKRPSYWNSTSGFVINVVTLIRSSHCIYKPHFVDKKINVRHIGLFLPIATSTIIIVIACYSASGYQISSKSGHPRRSYDVIYIFKMAAAAAPYYFRFRIWWYHSHPKQIKFRPGILIHG